jgi:hypothetical protein
MQAPQRLDWPVRMQRNRPRACHFSWALRDSLAVQSSQRHDEYRAQSPRTGRERVRDLEDSIR